jgi:hypothetical protein
MLKKFALLFALLVVPTTVFAQDEAAPPTPVPAEEAPAVVVGQGCVGCGTSSMVSSGCSSCGTTVSECDPCARAPRVRVFARRNACCTPAPTSCCTPAPVSCGCEAAPAACSTCDSCTPKVRTRLFARFTNKCEAPATSCCDSAPVATSDCGCATVAAPAPVAPVAQVSYTSECCDQPTVRTGLRPFGGSVLRRIR